MVKLLWGPVLILPRTALQSDPAIPEGRDREEEKRLIEEKMAQLQTKRIGAYLRKMAIDGYIIQVDTTDIREMTRALSAIGRNINQIAKRLNAGGPAYQADMEEIRERMDQIWQLQRRILLSQR
ncbi:plasmid mobilization protein [Intestinimonas butyriciproducens]|uniref:plasmid mobilization protein n=1 Tax=Intestinimonas butyriciproducens TaxID=1297617 RepID=UPI00389A62EE